MQLRPLRSPPDNGTRAVCGWLRTLLRMSSGNPPDVFQLLIDSCPQAVLHKLADPFGVLTSLTLARSISLHEEWRSSKVRKLEETLRTVRKFEQAKTILMKNKSIEEKEAYEYLRKHAMIQRVPIGRVASSVYEENEFLA